MTRTAFADLIALSVIALVALVLAILRERQARDQRALVRRVINGFAVLAGQLQPARAPSGACHDVACDDTVGIPGGKLAWCTLEPGHPGDEHVCGPWRWKTGTVRIDPPPAPERCEDCHHYHPFRWVGGRWLCGNCLRADCNRRVDIEDLTQTVEVPRVPSTLLPPPLPDLGEVDEGATTHVYNRRTLTQRRPS
jgi:hypothetical protein